MAGATSRVEPYAFPGVPSARAINFPGFNDYRPNVDAATDDYLANVDAFLLVLDIARGVSDTDCKIVEMIRAQKKPWLLCVNKVDLLRPDDNGRSLSALETRTRVDESQLIQCSFDPDPRLNVPVSGVDEVRSWLLSELELRGKDTKDVQAYFEGLKEPGAAES